MYAIRSYYGQVFQIRAIHLFHPVLHHGLGVLKFDRRQAAFQVAAIVPLVAALGDLVV